MEKISKIKDKIMYEGDKNKDKISLKTMIDNEVDTYTKLIGSSKDEIVELETIFSFAYSKLLLVLRNAGFTYEEGYNPSGSKYCSLKVINIER